MLFALKLTLVPVFIAGVTLGSRRWGPRIGGWLNAVPMVARPALLFLTIEQGAAFASRAPLNTPAGLIGVATFSLAYGWAALRRPWWIALATGWAAFAVVTVVLHAVPWQPWSALVASAAAFGLARVALPRLHGAFRQAPPPAWDLPLRMAAAVVLVVTVTELAERLGPRLSGTLTPIPIASAILLGFTHAQQGATAAIAFLRTFLPAMWSFVLFCFVLTIALVPFGWLLGFARELAKVGAHVVACGRRRASLEDVAGAVRAEGRRGLAVACDVGDGRQVDDAVSRTLNEFGRIDLLVNNAGYRIRSPFEDLPRQEWDAMVQTNLTGVFLLSQAVGRVRIRQRAGKIVNVTSVAGRTGSRGMAAYAATKAAVAVLTQSLGAEWAKYGITVNAVAPGPVQTEGVLAVWKTPAMIAQ